MLLIKKLLDADESLLSMSSSVAQLLIGYPILPYFFLLFINYPISYYSFAYSINSLYHTIIKL